MAEETAEEREERVSNENRERYESEGEKLSKAGVDARSDEPEQTGLETWEQYREHAAAVPGIFGDTDTSGTAPGVDSVPTKNVELGGEAVARVDEASATGSDEEQDEVEGTSDADALRQVDVAGDQPSAEEVQEGADGTESNPATAQELVAEAKDCDDRERLEELTNDDRKTVREAAEARLKELND